jgi:hypothetical protein
LKLGKAYVVSCILPLLPFASWRPHGASATLPHGHAAVGIEVARHIGVPHALMCFSLRHTCALSRPGVGCSPLQAKGESDEDRHAEAARGAFDDAGPVAGRDRRLVGRRYVVPPPSCPEDLVTRPCMPERDLFDESHLEWRLASP